jgi:hypothetical protein
LELSDAAQRAQGQAAGRCQQQMIEIGETGRGHEQHGEQVERRMH